MEALRGLLSNKKRFWHFTATLVGILAVCRGLSPANTWITTQAQIDYSQGFAKRALFGQLFTQPFHLYTVGRFSWCSLLFLAFALALLAGFVSRSGIAERIGYGEIVAVFWSSYCVTFFVNNLGYADVLLLSCATTLLLIRSDRLRFLLALPICLFALLLHEMFLIAFLPAVLFSFVLKALLAESSRTRRELLLLAGLLFGYCFAITLMISLQPTLSPEKIAALERMVHAHARFKTNDAFFIVLSNSFADNVRQMAHLYYNKPSWWLAQLSSVVFFLPPNALFWITGRRIARAANLPWTGALRWSALVAMVSPLALNLIGFDAVRWASLVGLTSFLVLLTLCFHTPGPAIPSSTGFVHACTLSIILGLSSGGSLLAGRLLSYPFFNDLDLLRPLQHLTRTSP